MENHKLNTSHVTAFSLSLTVSIAYFIRLALDLFSMLINLLHGTLYTTAIEITLTSIACTRIYTDALNTQSTSKCQWKFNQCI